MIVLNNADLSQFSSMRVGGIARKIFFPETEEEFVSLAGSYDRKIIVGKCSNIIFAKPIYEEPLIFTTKLDKTIFDGETVSVQCGRTILSLDRKSVV